MFTGPPDRPPAADRHASGSLARAGAAGAAAGGRAGAAAGGRTLKGELQYGDGHMRVLKRIFAVLIKLYH